MNILIELGSHHLNNLGDVVMLQVAISRLQQLFPNSKIQVFTFAPDRLHQYCPDAEPLSTKGRDIWAYPLSKFPSHFGLLNRIANYFDTSTNGQNLRKQFPQITRSVLRNRLRNCPDLITHFDDFTNAIFHADLLMFTGGGYFTDVFPYSVNCVLSTIELASKLKKPIAMLGQGLGPLNDASLFAKTQQIFPAISLFGLRENLAGPVLLQALGVKRDRVIITGDDAIEFAYQARPSQLGHAIGVNLRVSHYSNVDLQVLNSIQSALHQIAEQYQASLVPVPISRHTDAKNEQPDSVAIHQIIEGYSNFSDGGFQLDTPLKVIEQAGRCRVVVTASYHAGVFALSQGIPVVALVKSKYYVDKFLGLADQFGVGCKIIFLDEAGLEEKLVKQIGKLWAEAELLSPKLLRAAERQIQQGHAVYQKLLNL
jgi:polysaccharide pyruvyl transferase WcaK-like protein